jgi:hypothetical protein
MVLCGQSPEMISAPRAAACQRNFPKDYTGCSIRSIDVAGHNALEVSIGHALICDAIYLGFENTVQLYKRQLL